MLSGARKAASWSRWPLALLSRWLALTVLLLYRFTSFQHRVFPSTVLGRQEPWGPACKGNAGLLAHPQQPGLWKSNDCAGSEHACCPAVWEESLPYTPVRWGPGGRRFPQSHYRHSSAPRVSGASQWTNNRS